MPERECREELLQLPLPYHFPLDHLLRQVPGELDVLRGIRLNELAGVHGIVKGDLQGAEDASKL